MLQLKRSAITRILLTTLLALLTCAPYTAAQESWRYTAMGDSIATGYLAQQGYVSLYHGYLQTDNGLDVTLYNLAQNGATSANLLGKLRTDTVFQNAVQQSEVITWDIGLNDFRLARSSYISRKCGGKDNQSCLRDTVATFKANWDGILVEILARRSVNNTIIRTMDLYYAQAQADKAVNTFADSKEPAASRGNDFQVLSYYFNQMNDHIATTAALYGISLAAVHQAYNGASGDEDPVAKGYIASDGRHPSEAGHQVIANLFRGLGYAPLR